MRKFILVCIIIALVLMGCKQKPIDQTPTLTLEPTISDVIDYDLLHSIIEIKNALYNISGINQNSMIYGNVFLSLYATQNKSSLFLDEERLDLLNQHYNLLERMVLDGYVAGTDIDAIYFITEEDYLFYSEYLDSLIVRIVKDGRKIKTHLVSTYTYDDVTFNIINQVIGEMIDQELSVKRLEILGNSYVYEEFIENKGMLSIYYEPSNAHPFEFENIFLVPISSNDQVVVFYRVFQKDIVDISLFQLKYDENNKLVYEIHSYDPLDYIIQNYHQLKQLYENWAENQFGNDNMFPFISHSYEWTSLIRWTAYQDINNYIILEEKYFPLIQFDNIQDRILEDKIQIYKDLEDEFLSMIAKENINPQDIYRLNEITLNVMYELNLSEDDFNVELLLYPVLDLDLIQSELIDQQGVSQSIMYQFNEMDSNVDIESIDYSIRQLHTQTKQSIQDYLYLYGSHYGIEIQDLTIVLFIDYLESTGFLLP